jgi:hypothetical protein
MSKRKSNSFNDMIMIENIFQSGYDVHNMGGFVKYQNEHFDILLKNKKIIFVRDKRIINNIVIYNDLYTAYVNIFKIV